MKLADGLFLRCCREVSKQFPEIQYKELIVDNASMQLVMRPETFDILLLPNLYGDIVSDLAAGLVGGLGIVPGANMGETHAVFEAVHGSAPDIAGQGKANPTALMLSAVMLLIHLGETEAAAKLQKAVEAVYREGKFLTGDVGGTSIDFRIHRSRGEDYQRLILQAFFAEKHDQIHNAVGIAPLVVIPGDHFRQIAIQHLSHFGIHNRAVRIVQACLWKPPDLRYRRECLSALPQRLLSMPYSRPLSWCSCSGLRRNPPLKHRVSELASNSHRVCP